MDSEQQIIIPDLQATKWVDLMEIKLHGEIKHAEYVQGASESEADKKEAGEVLALAKKSLVDYKPDGTMAALEIGYIPPRKRSTLQAFYLDALKKVDPENREPETIERLNDIVREFVRWGIRGHKNFNIAYKSVSEKVGPMEYPVSDWQMVDVYESIPGGMLMMIFNEVMAYNTLSDAKKKQSSSPSGMTPTPSTVRDAEDARS